MNILAFPRPPPVKLITEFLYCASMIFSFKLNDLWIRSFGELVRSVSFHVWREAVFEDSKHAFHVCVCESVQVHAHTHVK